MTIFDIFLTGPVRVLSEIAVALGRVLAVLFGVVVALILAALLLSVPAGVFYAIYKAFPEEVPVQRDPGWIDTLIGDQFVIFSIRVVVIALAVVLIVAAFYMLMSVGARMLRREWLHKAGPFEAALVERASDEIDDVRDVYNDMLEEAWQTNEDLESRLASALDTLSEVAQERDALVAELARRDAAK